MTSGILASLTQQNKIDACNLFYQYAQFQTKKINNDATQAHCVAVRKIFNQVLIGSYDNFISIHHKFGLDKNNA